MFSYPIRVQTMYSCAQFFALHLTSCHIFCTKFVQFFWNFAVHSFKLFRVINIDGTWMSSFTKPNWEDTMCEIWRSGRPGIEPTFTESYLDNYLLKNVVTSFWMFNVVPSSWEIIFELSSGTCKSPPPAKCCGRYSVNRLPQSRISV